MTAILLVSVLLIAMNATGLQVNAWANQLESASYAMIALVGFYLLLTQAMRLWRRMRDSSAARVAESHATQGHGNPGHEHGHHHDHAHDDHHHDQHPDDDHGRYHAHGEVCDYIVDARQLAGPFSWRKVMAVVLSAVIFLFGLLLRLVGAGKTVLTARQGSGPLRSPPRLRNSGAALAAKVSMIFLSGELDCEGWATHPK